MQIEYTPAFTQALKTIESTQQNVFLTGKAGTGKSTLLSVLREQTEKNTVILAPTGIAALNVQGETIHSFFQFKPNVTLESAKRAAKDCRNKTLFKKLDTLIIDEISMVRADLLDCVDVFLRQILKKERPFGGKQMVFIGDLYQLAPVVTRDETAYIQEVYGSPYFFSAHVRKHALFDMTFIELEKVYRQQDLGFIDILNAIRNGSVTHEHLAILNKRVQPVPTPDTGYIYLTTTNADADHINLSKLQALESPLEESEAQISGDFSPKLSPTESTLQLKVGAQIMFLNNDPLGQWVNGTVGHIEGIHLAAQELIVRHQDGHIVVVTPYKWILHKYTYDTDTKTLKQENAGSFTQYPLKLAWAITIHKSQGKTFDNVIIDMGRGAFATGQTYVALSRCRTLEGIVLKKPITRSNILLDRRVVQFLTSYQYALANQFLTPENKEIQIQAAIEHHQDIEILYLKPNDEKSRRRVTPKAVGQLPYKDKIYHAVEAYCHTQKQERFFRLDRILELHKVESL